MPLKSGHSKETIQENIRRLIAEGYDALQAAGIAYNLAKKHKNKKREKGG
jgi:hypothetical protein